MAKSDSTYADPATANWNAFLRAWTNGHQEYVDDAAKFNAFYLGDQWDGETLAQLDAEGRPALTLNECMQVINSVRGHYSESRIDVHFRPLRAGATTEVAHTLTRLFDSILEHNDYVENVEPSLFEDGIIEDRGFIDVRVDFTDNLLGEVKLKTLNPRMVLIDPDATSYDPAYWSEVSVMHWMSLDDIEAYYGKDKRRKVESVATNPDQTFGQMSVKYETFSDADSTLTGFPVDETQVKAVRVIERQHRKMAKVRELVDVTTGDTREIPEHWTDRRASLVAQQFGLKIRKRTASRIRWTVTADHCTLHDDWSPYSEFTVVPYFPMFRRGRPSGLMRHLVDPQEQLNKIESQILHTINTTANSGWVVEQGSVVNMTTEELEQRGAETGLVLVYGRNRQPPQKIEANHMPTGLENYAKKSAGYIQNIPGAAPLLGKEPKSAVSGVALGQQQDKALLGLQVIFDNLDFTRKLVAQRVLECVQTYYSEERVLYVTDWRNSEEPEETVEVNTEGAAGEIINNITIGKYDVRAGSAPTRRSWEEHQFAQILELRKAGVMIPDHHIILNSQLAGRKEIAQQVKQMQGLGEPDEAQQKMQELEMARAESEVHKLQAQIAQLEAQAQHSMARAQTTVEGEQREQKDTRLKYEMELARLRADLEKTRANLESKREIAGIHSDARSSLTRYQELMRAEENERDRAADLAKEAARGQSEIRKEALRDVTELEKTRQQQTQRGLERVFESPRTGDPQDIG